MRQELLAFLPPNHPKCCCVSPESPSWHAGFAGSSGGLLQPLERENLVRTRVFHAWLRSPGCRHRPPACPGKGWGWPLVAPQTWFYGFHCSMGFSFSIQTALAGQSSKTGGKCLWGCVPGRAGRCLGGFSLQDLTLAGFHLFAVASIGPGREFSGTLVSPFPAGAGLPEADGHLTVQLLRGKRRGCHPGGHFGPSLISHERLQADENYS